MAEHEDDGASKLKVRRKRRRLYEAAPDAETLSPPPPRKFARPSAAKAAKRAEPQKKAPKPLVPEILDPVETEAVAIRGAAGLSQQRQAALSTVEGKAFVAAGVGLVPLPIVDAVALAGVLLGMLKSIAEIYGVEYDRQKGKIYVGALLGVLVPMTLLARAGRLLKLFPGLGSLGALLVPATTWATTWAVGRTFIRHFENGGTMHDFEPEKARPGLERDYAEARASAPG